MNTSSNSIMNTSSNSEDSDLDDDKVYAIDMDTTCEAFPAREIISDINSLKSLMIDNDCLPTIYPCLNVNNTTENDHRRDVCSLREKIDSFAKTSTKINEEFNELKKLHTQQKQDIISSQIMFKIMQKSANKRELKLHKMKESMKEKYDEYAQKLLKLKQEIIQEN